jgi:hypothetical protein
VRATVGFGVLVVAASVAAGCRYLPNIGKQRRAVEACKAAIDAYPSDAGPKDEYVDLNRVFFRHCAAMVRDDACRNALEWAAVQHGLEAIGTALAGCRRGYCASSDSFEPCTKGEFETRDEKVSAWGQLLGLIVAREAGSDAPAIAKALLNATGRRPPPPSLSMINLQPSVDDIRADVAADGTVTLTAGDGGLIASLPTEQVAAFLLGKGEFAGRAVTITASAGVDYQRVIRAIDALRQGGLPDVRFGAPR